jgi:hypothetical protein
MTQPQVQQRPPFDFLEDLQHAYPDPFDPLLPIADPVVDSSGPNIGTDDPDPIPPDYFPPSDIY